MKGYIFKKNKILGSIFLKPSFMLVNLKLLTFANNFLAETVFLY